MTKTEALALSPAEFVALIQAEPGGFISKKLGVLFDTEAEHYASTFRALFVSGSDPATAVQAFANEPPTVRAMSWVRMASGGVSDLPFIKYAHGPTSFEHVWLRHALVASKGSQL